MRNLLIILLLLTASGCATTQHAPLNAITWDVKINFLPFDDVYEICKPFAENATGRACALVNRKNNKSTMWVILPSNPHDDFFEGAVSHEMLHLIYPDLHSLLGF